MHFFQQITLLLFPFLITDDRHFVSLLAVAHALSNQAEQTKTKIS